MDGWGQVVGIQTLGISFDETLIGSLEHISFFHSVGNNHPTDEYFSEG